MLGRGRKVTENVRMEEERDRERELGEGRNREREWVKKERERASESKCEDVSDQSWRMTISKFSEFVREKKIDRH